MPTYHTPPLLVAFCAGILLLLASCAHHFSKDTSLNVVVDEMYSAMIVEDYSHLESRIIKAKDGKNPFIEYKIRLLSYVIKNIAYTDINNAKVHMKVDLNFENAINESYDFIDTWQNQNGYWRLLKFNGRLDDSQTGSHYRVKPYEFNPEDYKRLTPNKSQERTE